MSNKKYIAELEAAIRREEKQARNEAFDHYVEEAKDEVKKEAIMRFGFSNHGQIARIVWWMAAQNIDRTDYLVGAKKSTPEAYDVVNKVRDEAKQFIFYMHQIWLLYRTDGGFDQVEVTRKPLPEKACNKVNNSKVMLNQNTGYKREKCLQKCKKYLKFAVRSSFFFAVGLLLFQFPCVIVLGLFFLAEILLTE